MYIYSLNIIVDFRKQISYILKLKKFKNIFKLLVILIKKTVWFRILWKKRLLFHSRVLPQSYSRVPTHGLTPGSHPMVPSQGPILRSHPMVPPPRYHASIAPHGSTPGSRVPGFHPRVPPQGLGPTYPVCHHEAKHPPTKQARASDVCYIDTVSQSVSLC